MPVIPSLSRSRVIRQTNAPIVSRRRKAPATVVTELMLSPAAGVPTTPSWVKLMCPVPRQQESQWCWCATTLGIHQFHNSTDTTSQCQAANRILARTDSCTSPGSAQVNIPYYLDKALAAFGHLRSPIQPPLPASQVEQEIQANAPVGARVGWANGQGGHFMAIVGYLNATPPRIAIADPIYGQTDIDYAVYLAAYQGNGRWTHAYLTQ